MNLEERLERIIEQIDVGISEKKTKEEKDLFNKAEELYKEERYKERVESSKKNKRISPNRMIMD